MDGFTFRTDDGIVVVEVGKDGAAVWKELTLALRERLGTDGTMELSSLFDTARKEGLSQ